LFRHITDFLVALGPPGVLVLALLDSWIPIAGVFDVLLAFLASQRPAMGWWCAACAVLGSTAGNYLLFRTARKGGEKFLDQQTQSERTRRFRAWFERYGLITVFIPALIPIPMPLKLFVISAGALGTRLRTFLAVVLLARILRYFSLAALGVRLGHEGAAAFLRAHAWHFVAAAVLLTAVLFLAVRLSDRVRGGLRKPAGAKL